jgi:GMP synthase-like glutamine amidotransferase
LFSGLTVIQKGLQWHSVQVSEAPEHTQVLASSPLCQIQAMRVGAYAGSMQYHVEIEPDTVANWARVPAHPWRLSRSIHAAHGLVRWRHPLASALVGLRTIVESYETS